MKSMKWLLRYKSLTLVLVNVVLLARLAEFAWVYDGAPGSVLVLLSCTLAIFAINLPILFGFSVARYQEV